MTKVRKCQDLIDDEQSLCHRVLFRGFISSTKLTKNDVGTLVSTRGEAIGCKQTGDSAEWWLWTNWYFIYNSSLFLSYLSGFSI